MLWRRGAFLVYTSHGINFTSEEWLWPLTRSIDRDECKQHTLGFSGAQYKKFESNAEANAYVASFSVERETSTNAAAVSLSIKGQSNTVKFGYYAVAVGRTPGVYSSWDECKKHTSGFFGARYKKVATAAEAVVYLVTFGVQWKIPAGGQRPCRCLSWTPSIARPTVMSYGSTLLLRDAGLVFMDHGFPGARWKKFRSEEQARAYVDAFDAEHDVIYVDGSCTKNQQGQDRAGIGVWWGENDPRNLAERCPGEATSTRAELYAIVRVLETAPHTRKPFIIKTDSRSCIQCLRLWLPRWDSEGPRLKPVKDADMMRYLDGLLTQRALEGQKVHLRHVPGHSGIEGNLGADKLAKQGAMESDVPVRDWGALMARVDVEASDAALQAAARSVNRGRAGLRLLDGWMMPWIADHEAGKT
ncbi:ribonuclease H-like protein [Laetiporus sulphureus 93-53]|uniref:Ribonuclease H n=1 Tax=Laetiporus sulphureus 93-53 TaxID=1314785 RepID=A0A165C824_9APHY|nr:ribonuclease H-like protein [Laetiporus sulphureus 93-53]KZT02365.1 ribonuclease H-like protein [Laetiporus sulphureus 93-53]